MCFGSISHVAGRNGFLPKAVPTAVPTRLFFDAEVACPSRESEEEPTLAELGLF